MMEMIIIVQVFPKKTIYLHSARPVVALWQRAVHRLPYPRLAGEKVVGCISQREPWIALRPYRLLVRKRESAHEQSRPHH